MTHWLLAEELLWRGSLLPLGCAAVAKPADAICLEDRVNPFGAASRPSGSKLPRHRGVTWL
ncbi:hypothetical protein CEQ51_27790 [Pseudomonas thivervalensis]|uniref:Uncharacterized protein n=1 Tax=Pseudomonas thivervalensis TaxID=86265 RepID=A0A2Z4ZJA9_9PSED|nr:hypothetical protein CE140_27795 [Pseudomonas thivervalensis]AXA63714.1 hypothetical protein CEQ51_27790 [Pseudomonas thivervalensis]